MSLKEQAKEKKSKALEKMGDIYKEFLQSYLAWLYLQNPRFDEFLTNEELTNYLFNEIYIPNNISLYINTDSLPKPMNIFPDTRIRHQSLQSLWIFIQKEKDHIETKR